nr:hypothetical protein [Rhodospirillales bacterium]
MPYDEPDAAALRPETMNDAPRDRMPARAEEQRPAPPREATAQPPAPPQQPAPAQKPRGRRGLLLAVLAVAVVAVIIGGGWYWYSTRNEITTDDAYTDGDVVTVAPQVSGQVIERDVTDNQHVMPGQVL